MNNKLILFFSLIFISFSTISQNEIKKNNSKIDSILHAPIDLNNSVFTGYRIQKKADIIGANLIINGDKVNNIATASILQMLQGQVAGAWVGNEYSPGGGTMLRVRGFGTPNNNSPLIIIDGVPSQENLNFLNPNDVATISILKDASSTAIYGARGGNGVIEITTKLAEKENPFLTLDFYTGVQIQAKKLKMMGVDEYAELYKIQLNNLPINSIKNPIFNFNQNGGYDVADYIYPVQFGVLPSNYTYTNDSKNPDFGKTAFNITKTNKEGTDWQDAVFDPAKITNYNLGLSKKFNHLKLFISGNYYKQDGILRFTNFERKAFRINTEYKIWKFRIGENFTFSNLKQVMPNQDIFRIALMAPPMLSIYDITGGPYALGGSNTSNLDGFGSFKSANSYGVGVNPVANLYRNKDNTNKNSQLFGNVYLDFEILKNLNFRINYGIDSDSATNIYNQYVNIESAEPFAYYWYRKNKINTERKVLTNTLYFNPIISGKNVQILIGHETNKNSFLKIEDTVNGIGNWGNSGSKRSWNMLSYFSNLKYYFIENLLTEIVFRQDEFWLTNKIKTYSIGMKYNLSKWRVFDNSSIFNDLSIRGNFGKTNNQGLVGLTKFRNFYSQNNSEFTNTGYTNSINIGLYSTLFKNKLSLSFDYYSRETTFSGLFNSFSITSSTVYGNSSTKLPNFQSKSIFQNKGFDFILNYRYNIRKLKYNLNINISHYSNKVLNTFDIENLTIFNGLSNTKVGKPIGYFQGFITDGVIKDDAELAISPKYQGLTKAGTFKFKDIDDNKLINSSDIQYLGDPHPNLIYGLNLNLEFKAFSLNIFGQGTTGNNIYNSMKDYLVLNSFLSNKLSETTKNTWQKQGDIAKYPSFNSQNYLNTNFYVEDGSYFRMKNIELAYKLFKNSKVFIQGQNLLTITKYSGLEPEVYSTQAGTSLSDTNLGQDLGIYPAAKTYLVGLRFGL